MFRVTVHRLSGSVDTFYGIETIIGLGRSLKVPRNQMAVLTDNEGGRIVQYRALEIEWEEER